MMRYETCSAQRKQDTAPAKSRTGKNCDLE